MNTESKPANEYIYKLFENLIKWYENADKKAQIILGFNAAFVSFIVGIMLSKKADELKDITINFSWLSWGLLLVSMACIITSVLYCFWCLRSRLKMQDGIIKNLEGSHKDIREIKPEYIWYFGMVKYIEPDVFVRRIKLINEEDIVEAFSYQCQIISKNVYAKHKYVNYSFLFSSLSLFIILLFDLSYLYSLQ